MVDGAAEELWERGVRKAVFQEFRGANGEEVLEFQRYVFETTERAGLYFRAACVEGGRHATTEKGCGMSHVYSSEYVTQLLIHREREVYDVRFYGKREKAGALVRALERGFEAIACADGSVPACDE